MLDWLRNNSAKIWIALLWLALAAAAIVLIIQARPSPTAFEIQDIPTESPLPIHTPRPARTPRPKPEYDEATLMQNLNGFDVEGFTGRGVPPDIAFDIVCERLAKGEFLDRDDAERRLGEYRAYFEAIGSLG